jgi:hypothetical protein
MKIFISYSLEDKNDAGTLHGLLSLTGFECFLAHRDIKKGEQWRDAIVRELKASSIFIPILSDHGLSSAWVQQECGMAHLLRSNKSRLLIIPLTINASVPPGCLSIYQAMSVNLRYFGLGGVNLSHEVAKRLSLEIAEQTECMNLIKPSAIKNLGHAAPEDAAYLLGFLFEAGKIQFEDFLLLITQASKNQRLICSDTAMNYLYRFLDMYRDEIGAHPDWVTAWNGLHNRYQNHKTEERRRLEKAMQKLTEATRQQKSQ